MKPKKAITNGLGRAIPIIEIFFAFKIKTSSFTLYNTEIKKQPFKKDQRVYLKNNITLHFELKKRD